VTLFDPSPAGLNLTPVVPGIFNFTTINIAAGSTLKFTENKYHGPVYFLASGDVTISGTMDLSGDNSYGPIGFASQRVPNAAGSGGFSGGIGGFGSNLPLPGNGPGGGAAGSSSSPGPGYGTGGSNTANQFLVPLIGGSGGGGEASNGAIGGAGGGALLIASSTTITVNGAINASGGSGSTNCAGSGAGGSVRLIANSIGGGGNVQVVGANSGCSNGTQSGSGLARFETNDLSGVGVGGPTTRSTPFALNLPSTGAPSVTVTSINGQAITSNPFSFPDITINTSSQVPIVVQATNVPHATAVVTIIVFSETGPDQMISIGPLVGTDASSTATANITYPPGGSRGYVKATW
jgi:hypothetical protein